MSSFTGQVKSALNGLGDDSGKTFNTSFIDVIKGSAIGSAIGGLAGKLGSTFMSGISTGISRLDTLENFPRVMESFGYSADDASAAVQGIMEHLRGLPTASQDVVQLTQAISDSTNDINLASRAALGFNDMLLAAGASTQDTAVATGVLNRVLGKGSATTAQWQSLMGVMPKQLDLVAESMLGAGASSMDLYAALEDGTVSWNDFLQAIVRLDEEGVGATSSFYEQAKANSIGVGSAIENIQNRVGAGWANVLKAIGQKEIHDTLEGVADALKAPLDALASGIETLKEKIGDTSIMQNAAVVFDTLKEAISGLWNDGGPDILNGVADGIINLVDNALQWLVDHGDAVKTAIGGIAGALAVLAGWKLGTDLMQLPGILGGIAAAISANPLMALALGIGAVVMGLYTFFTQTETGKQIWSDFTDLLSTTWEGLKKDWGVLMDVLGQEWESFKAWLGGIPDWWQGVLDSWNAKVEGWKQWWSDSWDTAVESVKTAGENIKTGLSDAISAATEWVTSKIDEFVAWWDKSWQEAADSIVKVGNDIKNGVSTAWTNLKTNTQTKWNEMKANASTAWTNLKTTVSNKASEAKTAATNAWDNLKTSTSDRWNSIKSTVSERVTSMKDAVVDKFNTLKSDVSSKWESIKSSITDKITAAKNKVSEMIESIKSLFNFHVSWPHIPLPHFSVSGSANPLDWLTNGVPSISVSWYAKGAIFTKPTVLPGLGDVREAAIPLNKRSFGEIAHGIAGEMGNGGNVTVTGNTFYIREEADIDRVAEALNRKIRRERWAMA